MPLPLAHVDLTYVDLARSSYLYLYLYLYLSQ